MTRRAAAFAKLGDRSCGHGEVRCMVDILSTVRCLNGADGQGQVTFYQPNEHVHREPKPTCWQAFCPLGRSAKGSSAKPFWRALTSQADVQYRVEHVQ